MAFNFLENRLNKTIKKAKSRAILNEDNINELLEEIRLVLLESDVNLDVANSFVADVKEEAMGQIVDFNNTSSQELLKIINTQLTDTLGGEAVN
jgi:signal recognition particle subunit SRP54